MGKIILIGGHIDKGTDLSDKEKRELNPPKKIRLVKPEIFSRFIKEAGGYKARIEIVTSASQMPVAIGREYKKAFLNFNCRNVGVMHIKNQKVADCPKFLERLERCDGILFTGGNQSLLCSRLLNTQFVKRLKERYKYEPDFLISGTSAGAMCLSKFTITEGKPLVPFVKGQINLINGFDILPRIIVDTHFIQRRRLSRLIEAVAYYPEKLGIGLAENTAIFFNTPDKVEVIGNNVVVLIDGKYINFNNIKQIRNSQNICLQDVKLHVLPKGQKFSITRRKICR